MEKKLREIRMIKGFNQRELSELAHTPQLLVSSIERERLKPWPKVAKRMSKALGIPIKELFPEDFNK
jgi:transcriptional regulator with XRE-family HTH domain